MIGTFKQGFVHFSNSLNNLKTPPPLFLKNNICNFNKIWSRKQIDFQRWPFKVNWLHKGARQLCLIWPFHPMYALTFHCKEYRYKYSSQLRILFCMHRLFTKNSTDTNVYLNYLLFSVCTEFYL